MTPEFLGGNRLTLLRSGSEYFPALESALRDARNEIYLETYIFADDVTGRRVLEALADAARRGVATHLLIDGFGSHDLMPRDLAEQMDRAGARFLVFRPDISPFRFRRAGLRRMHRKIAVVDRRIAFLGGINVIDDMHTPGHTPPRYDFAVRIEGPLIRAIQFEVEKLWSRVAWVHLRRRWRVRRHAAPEDIPKGTQRAALVVRDNFRHRSDIEDAYLAAIGSAKREIIIASAYFFPGKGFRQALREAARRGIRVVLLLQGRVEYLLLHYASRALYGTLLDAGIEIREYTRSFLHAKVAVIDGVWATVGSSNIDPFSLMLAREANVLVRDAKFSGELRRALHEALESDSIAIQKDRWFRQPLWRRMLIWASYALARLLMGIFGYADRR